MPGVPPTAMSNVPQKVLLVAFLDQSRDAVYEVSTGLKEAGYGIDICFAHQDEEDDDFVESKITPDLYLTDKMDLQIYSGVVFFDDGADSKASEIIAKRAEKVDIAIGGYSHGVQILNDAGLLKDKFVAIGFPKEFYKGAKQVNSPAVRSENVVTASGNCAAGFVMLMIDALGGSVLNIVESSSSPVAIPNTFAVISRLERWPEYWELAERLAQVGKRLMIADWERIDVRSRTVAGFLTLEPGSSVKVQAHKASAILPANLWFKQTSIGSEETIAAVEALEAAGCTNVNSSETIKTASDKLKTAEILGPICYQGSPTKYDDSTVEQAIEVLSSVGTRWVKPIDASLGRGVMRIQGRGRTAIVSRRIAGNAVHRMMNKAALSKVLRSAYNRGPFMVQEDLGSLYFGDKNFELRFIMRRGPSGWKASSEIARAGTLISNPNFQSTGIKVYACSAKQALKLVDPDKCEARLAAARQVAEAACIAFQSGLSNPNGANELGIDITFSGDEPNVIEINSIPDLTFVDYAAKGKNGILSMAYSMGTETEQYEDVPDQDVANSRGDIARTLGDRSDDRVYRRLMDRELGNQRMHLQGQGKIAIFEGDEYKVMLIPDAIRALKTEVRYYTDKFNKAHVAGKEQEAGMLARVVRRAMHRLRLVYEAYFLDSKDKELVKKADYAFNFTGEEYEYGEGSVPGPYSNVRMPDRVIQWREGDDWLKDTGQIDDETIRNLSRYNPEQHDGFYAEFDLMHRNDPIPFDKLKDEGIYPSRQQLWH